MKNPEVPFYKQSWDHSQWKDLGFSSEEDAQYWKKSSCGILCLKMAVDGLSKTDTVSVAEYIKQGKDLDAYTHEHGWTHVGLMQVAKHMGVQATTKERVTVGDLKAFADQGCLSIISVKPNFETTKTLREKLFFWKRYGGHMALVVGYEEGTQAGFFVHHTSKKSEYNGPYIFIPLKQFTQGFTGRAVVVCK